MHVKNSPLIREKHHVCRHDIGDIYFFKDFAIVEYNEGIIISFENIKPLLELSYDHFGTQKPFATIVNKVNPISIVPTDVPLIEYEQKNLIAIAVVNYNKAANNSFALENHFFSRRRKEFYNLLDARKWVKNQLNLIKI